MLLADTVVMIRPSTAVALEVMKAFDEVVHSLRRADLQVLVFADESTVNDVDAVFVNNWLCTLPDGTVAVLPMQESHRRREKRDDILELLQRDYQVSDIEDWSEFEADGFFLEGTGSMVMDHTHKLIYSCLSQKTHRAVLEKFASAHQYRAMVFDAVDRAGKGIHYTNNILSLGKGFAWMCEEAFSDDMELMAVKQLLLSTGHVPISFSLDQAHKYAGNSIQVQNTKGEALLLMGKAGYDQLHKHQIKQLEKYTTLLPLTIDAIENTGHGSIRAMVSELYLQKQ